MGYDSVYVSKLIHGIRQIATGHTLALLGQQGLVAVVVRWESWRWYRSDDGSMHLLVRVKGYDSVYAWPVNIMRIS